MKYNRATCAKKTMTWLVLAAIAPVAFIAAADVNAITAEEMRTKDEWVKAHLLAPSFKATASPPKASSRTAEPGLDVYANNDPVIQNHRNNRPLCLNGKNYKSGLYCHAVSKVVVTLPGPGKRFTADIGLDYNDDTLRGQGSVVFSVTVKGRTAFTSPVMKVRTPAQKVDVDLAGATTFTLDIGDAGDGIGWDQSNWADAKVVLGNGQTLWLGDMALRDHRHGGRLEPIQRSSRLPFAFTCNGAASDACLKAWPQKQETGRIDENRTRHALTWQDPKSGLEVRCVAVNYVDYPAVEWTVYFKNKGKVRTGILENIQALDMSLVKTGSGEFVLHSFKGDTCSPQLYQPATETLPPGTSRHFAPNGGRGTNGAFPYYKIEMTGGGLLMAVGWPGQWASSFMRDNANGLRILAGQELTHLALEPGEEIRTPLMALLFWQGDDPVRAQNIWRRWMWAHNVPRTADGKLPPPMLFGNTSLHFHEMIHANTANQKHFIDRYREERIPLDFWWMDAGWYPCNGHWPQTGTWETDTTRFPGGLRVISDHALGQGVRTLVWFEPERIGGGWLSRNHPEWRLGSLLNLGHPDARRWLVDHVDGQLKSQGIHLYRQDFNMDPLGAWRGNDAPDRQGITENLHIQGYLAYWDELRKRHPQLIIDSCASGGRRNDLETMRRAVALHPTDYNYGHLAVKQAFHHSLYQWLPYYGSNTIPIDTVDPYAIRSGYAMGLVFCYDMRRKDLDYPQLRKLAREWRRIMPCFHGDFYPSTPYSLAGENWIAWQFHHAGKNMGVIQAFRRAESHEASQVLPVSGVDPDTPYRVMNMDEKASAVMTGRTLLEKGLSITIPDRPGAAVVFYETVVKE